ncbi:hypothetical protein L226DRAFT_526165 [Lentinus tigrinus ALCF2SS1-7]|uniref:Homeobox domain-containing protein n=1 Tax=Lentinus tigrinus ALCF2SS1-6 TaxID=1328759 RepID=A0A5C2RWN1_9APHY|nr:hypothetical protein L227DRAFT_566784 [Lentinus tigrinus ALCF2SS1-6]RPD70145.1 hypothetical protein L226DRAFT_526165 [Lentinus tigrinus ALCF2SS1-7]
MSRNAADAPSSAPSNPTDEQLRRTSRDFRRTPSRSPSRRTLPTDPQPLRGASPSSHIASQPIPSTSSSRIDTDTAAATTHASDPESSSRRRKRERSSPSGSSSQGDMADTEMEGGPSKPSPSESAPEGPPPKKKRTRTLTTPHQAAVLHALLAQSRFPTTQMREEVGRSIGLSARKVQNQRQKARRPRGQASTTSAPLTRPPQFGPFTNAPPGTSGDVSPTTFTGLPAASPEGFFSRGPGGVGEMAYGGASAPSSASSERFAHSSHRDAYLAEEYARSGMPPTQLAGPGIPGSSRRATFEDQPWRTHPQPFSSSRPSTSAASLEASELYRLTPRPGRPAGEQGPELTLTLPPVMTNVPRSRGGPMSSPISPLSAGAYPSLASLSALEAGTSAQRPRSFDEPRRTLPPPNVDFSAPRPVLNIPPPFTLQPQPQWDDPAFSPFSRRRSPPALPHGVAPPFGSSPTSPFRPEPLPSLSSVIPMSHTAPPMRSPESPIPRTRSRFDPVRSTAGRAPPEHPARPGFHDSADEPPAR